MKNDIYPAWSPDGTSLMFESDRDGDRSLYTYDLTTATALHFTGEFRDATTGLQ